MERALRRAARDSALPEPRRGPLRPANATSSSTRGSPRRPFDETPNRWEVGTDQGDVVSAQLSHHGGGQPVGQHVPRFKGLESFAGKWYHTGHWPHGGVDFSGKRVGVVGTGSTACRPSRRSREQAGHLTVFQRTPNYCVPARNGRVDPAVVKARKADYAGDRRADPQFVLRLRRRTSSPSRRSRTTPEERERDFDAAVGCRRLRVLAQQLPGYAFVKEANDTVRRLPGAKIRATVKDPAVAEKLMPEDLPVRHQAPAAGHQLLRDLQPGQRHAG